MKFINNTYKKRNKNKENTYSCVKFHWPFRSMLEETTYNYIRKYFPDEEISINTKGLIKSNKRLELDLYFPQYKIGIEIQGPTHTQTDYAILQDYEKQKKYLKESNIKIIYIYTNNYKNKKSSITKCINIIENERRKRRKK